MSLWGPNLANPYQLSGQPVPAFFSSDAVHDIHTPAGYKVGQNEAKERFVFLGSLVVRDAHLLPADRTIVQSRLREIRGASPSDLDELVSGYPLVMQALRDGLCESMLIRTETRVDASTSLVWIYGFPGLLKGPFPRGHVPADGPTRTWTCSMIPDLHPDHPEFDGKSRPFLLSSR
jgi:hypothetical protein